MSMSTMRPIAKKYKVGKELGKGSFGTVYLGIDITSGEEVAIKTEKMKTKHPQLQYESRIYRLLQGGEGIPSIRFYGTESGYNILIIDCLGPSLEDIFTAMNRRFTPLTVIKIASQMIRRIEYMHKNHFIHRDIKPDNFLSGIGRKSDTLYIIDFGLSKRYRHPKSKKHMNYREGKNLTGTPRYASINNHLGVEQSRRDDMESIGYVLIYFAKGSLPWQGLKANTKRQKYQKIMDKKMSVAIPALCSKVPGQLKEYIEYCRSLRFEDKPNYPHLIQIFDNAIQAGIYGDPDTPLDWVKEATSKRTSLPQPPPPVYSSQARLPPVATLRAENNMSMNNIESQYSGSPMHGLAYPPAARISKNKDVGGSGFGRDDEGYGYGE